MAANPKTWPIEDLVDMVYQRDPAKYELALKFMNARNRKGVLKLYKEVSA